MGRRAASTSTRSRPGYIATDNTQALQDDPVAQHGHPRPDPGRPLGRRRGPRRRDGLPRLGRLGLRQRHRPAGRRRLARPMTRRSSTVSAALGVASRRRRSTDADDCGRAARLDALAAGGAAAVPRSPCARRRRSQSLRSAGGGSGAPRRRRHGARARSRSKRRGGRRPVHRLAGLSTSPWSRACRALGVPVLPGVATADRGPGRPRRRHRRGQALPRRGRSAASPMLSGARRRRFPAVRFVPTGGIGADRPGRLPRGCRRSLAVGGTWIVRDRAACRRRFDEIAARRRGGGGRRGPRRLSA